MQKEELNRLNGISIWTLADPSRIISTLAKIEILKQFKIKE